MNARVLIPPFAIGFTLLLISPGVHGKEVPLASLPEKVQQAVKAQTSGGALVRVEEDSEGGEKTFDAVIKRGAAERSLTFTEAGRLTHAQVFESELPAAVQQVLHAEFSALKPAGTYRVTEDNDPYFQFDFGGASTNSLYIAESARWWSLEIPNADAPAAVLATIKRELGASDAGTLSKTKEDGQIYYEFETETEDGRGLTVNISPDGKLISREEEVPLAQVLPAAQKTIHAHVGDGKLLSVTKRTVADGFVFDVEAERGGKIIEFTVGPHGKIRAD